jgi:hypothetical protein
MAASLRGREPRSRGTSTVRSRYQTAQWRQWLRTLGLVRQWFAKCSHEFVLKCPINAVTNPNPVYSHCTYIETAGYKLSEGSRESVGFLRNLSSFEWASYFFKPCTVEGLRPCTNYAIMPWKNTESTILDFGSRWRRVDSFTFRLPAPVPTGQETGWVPELVLTLWRKEMYRASARNQTPTIRWVPCRCMDLAKPIYSVPLFTFIWFDYIEYIIMYTGRGVTRNVLMFWTECCMHLAYFLHEVGCKFAC